MFTHAKTPGSHSDTTMTGEGEGGGGDKGSFYIQKNPNYRICLHIWADEKYNTQKKSLCVFRDPKKSPRISDPKKFLLAKISDP